MKKFYIFLLGFLIAKAFGWNSFEHFPPLKIPFHPVSTNNIKAQEAFDQGLLGIYSFNYEGAYERFHEAAVWDPHLAMAYWGMAMALDEKFSPKPTQKEAELVYNLATKAQELSKKGSDAEKSYIEALLVRLSPNPEANKMDLRKAYAQKMKDLVHQFPDDPDALTLYAESLMDLIEWDLWKNGKPRENVEEIISVIEAAIAQDPWHVGANHYYIHAIEHSPHPEYGLMSAERLDALAFLFDDWSHLLHTPSHIYMKVGYYDKAIADGKRAIKADKMYAEKHKKSEYAIHGLTHNLSFLIMAYLWAECYEGAVESATLMSDSVKPVINKMPGFQYHMLYLPEVYLYFDRFDKILDMKEPPKDWSIAHTYWHFTRGMAFSGLKDIASAEEERKAFLEEKEMIKSKKKFYDDNTFRIAAYVLEAAIAHAKGEKEESISLLRKAAEDQEKQDFLDWYEPLRARLAKELLEIGNYKDAQEEFRRSLLRYPLNCRVLKGLGLSLKAQGKESYWPERESREERQCNVS